MIQNHKKRILVVGTGYVGLVAATCFAQVGHEVVSLDIDEAKIEALKRGSIPIYEPGLEELCRSNMQKGHLRFTTDYSFGVDFADIVFLAVATPSLADGEADLRYLRSAVRSIAKHMQKPLLIVNKSTVPIGTTEEMKAWLLEDLQNLNHQIDFEVAFNPEFMKEGEAINDFLKPDRVVIGANSAFAASELHELYLLFQLRQDQLLFMDIASAEMTKYASNAMLATRISFMNEMALLAEKKGADIHSVRRGMGKDRRIGADFLHAGVGYGGSCFPKDLRALCAIGKKEGISTPLLEAVEEVNERQKTLLERKISDYFEGNLFEKTIAIWGLSFKPGTDDMREAPSLALIRSLLERGAFLRLYDPVAMSKAKLLLKASPQIVWCESASEAALGAHAIALVTEWKQFREVDLKAIGSIMVNQAFFDGRNQFVPEKMAELGFDYHCIGRKVAYQKVCTP